MHGDRVCARMCAVALVGVGGGCGLGVSATTSVSRSSTPVTLANEFEGTSTEVDVSLKTESLDGYLYFGYGPIEAHTSMNFGSATVNQRTTNPDETMRTAARNHDFGGTILGGIGIGAGADAGPAHLKAYAAASTDLIDSLAGDDTIVMSAVSSRTEVGVEITVYARAERSAGLKLVGDRLVGVQLRIAYVWEEGETMGDEFLDEEATGRFESQGILVSIGGRTGLLDLGRSK